MTGWSYADQSELGNTNPLQIESIVLTPDPPEPGKDLKAVITATVTNEIAEGAYADVTVKLGLIKMIQKQFDLFTELKNRSEWTLTADSGSGAPVTPGPVVLTFDGKLPREIPRAQFTVLVRAFTVDDDELATLDFKVNFMK
ncbi:ML domain-containing protein [Streptomyces hundungensis]|uniref:ML domain-containing protein n=1 Tax=Streptomyces hundungensis TaxID=1077946 RepID=UPI0033DC1985